MRWCRATVQPFLDVRTAVLNDMLEAAFRRRYGSVAKFADQPASLKLPVTVSTDQ
jgi:hypothetical protein